MRGVGPSVNATDLDDYDTVSFRHTNSATAPWGRKVENGAVEHLDSILAGLSRGRIKQRQHVVGRVGTVLDADGDRDLKCWRDLQLQRCTEGGLR